MKKLSLILVIAAISCTRPVDQFTRYTQCVKRAAQYQKNQYRSEDSAIAETSRADYVDKADYNAHMLVAQYWAAKWRAEMDTIMQIQRLAEK